MYIKKKRSVFLAFALCAFFALFSEAESRCSDRRNANDCHRCVKEGCSFCPGVITTNTMGGCFGGGCVRKTLNRKCVRTKNERKHGRECSSADVSVSYIRSGAKCPDVVVDQIEMTTATKTNNAEEEEEEDIMDRTAVVRSHNDAVEKGRRGLTASESLALAVRVLKTGFVTSIVLHTFFGVSIMTGPAAPFVMVGGAILFLVYSIFEKKMQKMYEKELEHLMKAAEMMVNAMVGKPNSKEDKRNGGMIGAYEGLISSSERYAKMIDMKNQMNAKLKHAEDIEQHLEDQSRSEKSRNRMHELGKGLHALETTLEKMGEQIDGIQKHINTLKVKLKDDIELLQAEICGVKTLAGGVAKKIFGKKFQKIVGGWDKVLAGASVAVAGYDISHIAETVGALSSETAGTIAELGTTAIHGQEAREFFEEESHSDISFEKWLASIDEFTRDVGRVEGGKIVQGLARAIQGAHEEDEMIGGHVSRVRALSRHPSFFGEIRTPSSSDFSFPSSSFSQRSLSSKGDESCTSEYSFLGLDLMLEATEEAEMPTPSVRHPVVDHVPGVGISLEKGSSVDVQYQHGGKSTLRRRGV